MPCWGCLIYTLPAQVGEREAGGETEGEAEDERQRGRQQGKRARPRHEFKKRVSQAHLGEGGRREKSAYP